MESKKKKRKEEKRRKKEMLKGNVLSILPMMLNVDVDFAGITMLSDPIIIHATGG